MNSYMKSAIEEAFDGMNSDDGGPFGALIIRDNTIIASAHNEVLKTNDPTAHAEINAIRRASEKLGTYDLSDCILYTTCYPCPMCMGAIFWARIPAVYYASSMEDAARGGFDDRVFYERINHPESSLNLQSIDIEKGQELFASWLAKNNRQMY